MHAPIYAMVAITSGTTLFRLIEDAVSLLEVLAVAVIIVSVLLAIVAGIRTLGSGAWAASAEAKRTIANGVLLGLELLIAADVIQTVTLERTLSNTLLLGILVVIRTFLSWSLFVEINGRWPWRSAPTPPAEAA
ncbi:MAG TPA: DUF1622 domain-containing protein [Actinomycetota bacterium]|nr:DUF1622 domain-containing protein [Actinomycetota bacterium]